MTEDQETPASPTVWDLVREDYLAGDSATVVAERHGLSQRSVRRHAAANGWRRADLPEDAPGRQPDWSFRRTSADQNLADDPELKDVLEARQQDAFFLLFDPKHDELRRFAFRRVAEAAAMAKPREAVMWMRLVRQLDQSSYLIEDDARPFEDGDLLRAACLRRINEEIDANGAPCGRPNPFTPG